MSIKKIVLKKGKEKALERKHLWIFSGAIYKKDDTLEEGDLVEVLDGDDRFIATGYYGKGSIAVRIIRFEPGPVDKAFWKEKLEKAWSSREKLGFPNNETNMYRLFHGEGDGIPGLIIDVFDKRAVLQSHTQGIAKQESILREILLAFPQIDEVQSKSTREESKNLSEGTASLPRVQCMENKLRFWVDTELGQKTGFFIDQRENRKLLQHYCQGKKVLNLFCYTGGFSLYAIAGGAKEVNSVDSSEDAIQVTRENVELNFPDYGKHQAYTENVFDFLAKSEEQYDIIVVDPPAFAKSRKASHNAIQGYKRLNQKAMEKVKPGGLIFTFSCSQVVTTDLFKGAILSAGIGSGRSVKILHQLSQGADHPINLFHPEGEYLKGLVLELGD